MFNLERVLVKCPLTKHPFGRLHSENVRRRIVLQRNSSLVADWQTPQKVGSVRHLEAAVGEVSHGVDPGLLRRVHEAGVDPAGHPVQLKSIKYCYYYCMC